MVYSYRSISIAPNKWLRPVLGPLGEIIKGRRVPDNLEEELWDRHRVRGRTGGPGFECPVYRVRHVAAVVGAVEVHAVPASIYFISVSLVTGPFDLSVKEC